MSKLAIIFILSLFFFNSCHNSSDTAISRKKIEVFIERYQKENFLEYQGILIYIRQITPINIIYALGKSSTQYEPLYFVTYNELISDVTEINRDHLKNKDNINVPDYLSDNEITFLVKKMAVYKFAYLEVDSIGNVFINPFQVMSPALFLRTPNISTESQIKKIDTYKKYKDNWYINSGLLSIDTLRK